MSLALDPHACEVKRRSIKRRLRGRQGSRGGVMPRGASRRCGHPFIRPRCNWLLIGLLWGDISNRNDTPADSLSSAPHRERQLWGGPFAFGSRNLAAYGHFESERWHAMQLAFKYINKSRNRRRRRQRNKILISGDNGLSNLLFCFHVARRIIAAVKICAALACTPLGCVVPPRDRRVKKTVLSLLVKCKSELIWPKWYGHF